jgi:dihydrofolate reductase
MKLVITENITLDGVIEASNGWFGPAGHDDAIDTSDIEAALRTHMHQQDGLLLGRKTFEELRGYWPHQTDDTTGVSDHLDRITKYVISTTVDDPGWANTVVLKDTVLREVQALKEAPGGDLGVTGSITLVHTLIRERLVDEYRLFVFPFVIGSGRRLFPDGVTAGLSLTEAKPFRSGVTLLIYRPT